MFDLAIPFHAPDDESSDDAMHVVDSSCRHIVDAEDLSVQVRTDGSRWHRRAIGGRATACGAPIERGWDFDLRYETYRGELCTDGCFSKFELAESDRANREDEDSR